MFCRAQVAQLRDHLDEIRAQGAELVVVGNGGPHFAAAFRDDHELDAPLLVDADRTAYRAAGLARGIGKVMSWRTPLNALRTMRRGFRQGPVQGDAWQLGGVFVLRRGGAAVYAHRASDASDHPPIDAVLEALAIHRTDP